MRVRVQAIGGKAFEVVQDGTNLALMLLSDAQTAKEVPQASLSREGAEALGQALRQASKEAEKAEKRLSA